MSETILRRFFSYSFFFVEIETDSEQKNCFVKKKSEVGGVGGVRKKAEWAEPGCQISPG